ncbi:hypothetical protein L7F22_043463 [Adiantum nelumboides]|nr:hypothetical protein [Adiantum nelumboides]
MTPGTAPRSATAARSAPPCWPARRSPPCRRGPSRSAPWWNCSPARDAAPAGPRIRFCAIWPASRRRRPDPAGDLLDYLGWKDTLALRPLTERQRAYARGRGARQVFTPQVVVDGNGFAVGSDRPALDRLIREACQHGGLPVPVRGEMKGDRILVEVGAAPEAKTEIRGDVWLVPVLRSRAIAIQAGENGGRTATYVNVVRGMQRLGHWTASQSVSRCPMPRPTSPTRTAGSSSCRARPMAGRAASSAPRRDPGCSARVPLRLFQRDRVDLSAALALVARPGLARQRREPAVEPVGQAAHQPDRAVDRPADERDGTGDGSDDPALDGATDSANKLHVDGLWKGGAISASIRGR